MTLVEVVLAVVILAVGLLAMVGTGAAVTALIAEGGWHQRTSTLAREQFEILYGRPCVGIGAGAVTRGALSAVWAVSGAGSARRVVLTVTSPRRRGPRSDVFEALIPCQP